jgi:hypothetical protein
MLLCVKKTMDQIKTIFKGLIQTTIFQSQLFGEAIA